MATTRTTRARLGYPGAVGDRNWHLPIQETIGLLDAANALGALCVAATELPSASLNVRVSPGAYQATDGTTPTYAGTTSLTLASSSTVYLWIAVSSGALTTGAAWPATTHVRLAIVTTGATTITSIADARLAAATSIPRRADATQNAITDSTGGSAASDTITGANVNGMARLIAEVNEIRTTLVAAGLWKGSA